MDWLGNLLALKATSASAMSVEVAYAYQGYMGQTPKDQAAKQVVD